jgi:hypothetical protein
MKIVELTDNLNIALTNEEADFLLKFHKKDSSKYKFKNFSTASRLAD